MGETDRSIDRRKALKQIAVGGAVIATINPGDALAGPHQHVHAAAPPAAAAAAWKPLFFNAHQNETVIILSELIIPATDTPGAKAAKVNEFIDLMLSEEDSATKREFLRGLAWMDMKSNELYGVNFKDATPQQQTALLVTLSSGKNTSLEDQLGVEFFNTIKSYTINGYYTSEIGLIKELGYKGNSYLDDFAGCTHPEHQE
jgi:glucoside 3-dehydrogenase (cytochrome c) hitch-hiker subunit